MNRGAACIIVGEIALDERVNVVGEAALILFGALLRALDEFRGKPDADEVVAHWS